MENTPLEPILWGKILGGSGGGGGSVQSVNGKTGAVVLTAADLDDSFKDALLDCFANVAWATEDGQQYYDALESALYPIDHITAAYTQSGTVYDTDSLDSLKTDLVVTAFYVGGTSAVVEAANYTLSGTLSEGTSTITVSYRGKTADFTVMVTHSAIPSGYIENGLVFFLNGKSAQSNEWVDIVGNKSFTLTDCTVSSNGVVFNGTSSKGICSGQITADWENETIELCVSNGNFASSSGVMFFTQPFNTSVGISFRCGYDTTSIGRAAIGLDGVSRQQQRFTTTGLKTLSATTDAVVVNGTLSTQTTHTTDYGKNLMGETILGAGNTLNNDGYRLFFSGTIHAVRIYNRKLSVAEMQANQAVDVTYYGL